MTKKNDVGKNEPKKKEFSIEEVLEDKKVKANKDIVEYLNMLKGLKLPKASERVFLAYTESEIYDSVLKEWESWKAKRQTEEVKKKCKALVDGLLKGNKERKRIISPEELLPLLEEFVKSVNGRKAKEKAQKEAEKMGITYEEYVEMLK